MKTKVTSAVVGLVNIPDEVKPKKRKPRKTAKRVFLDAFSIIKQEDWWCLGKFCVLPHKDGHPSHCAVGAMIVADGFYDVNKMAKMDSVALPQKVSKQLLDVVAAFNEYLRYEGARARTIAPIFQVNDRYGWEGTVRMFEGVGKMKGWL